MMTMKSKGLLALMGCATFLALTAGCTPEARQDVGKAGDNLSSATQKSAEGTAEAVDKAGQKVADASKDAVQSTERAAVNAGKDIKQGAENAGAAVSDATKDAAATVSLTPKVRNAIVADSNVKIPDLNVDTKNDTKTVVVMGTAPSAEQKTKAIADAKKALSDAKSDYKLDDQLKVGAAK